MMNISPTGGIVNNLKCTVLCMFCTVLACFRGYSTDCVLAQPLLFFYY